MMTGYEVCRLALEPVLPPLYKHIRHRLSYLTRNNDGLPEILDVGGRKSPYTIGIKANITIIDKVRESALQDCLNLGLNERLAAEISKRRSNIKALIFGDMTASELPDDAFDIVVAVEVLEHVEEDEKFVSEVFRVLRPNGIFLMSTPNGDWVTNNNPDHKRHYKRSQLALLLGKFFADVSVDYAIAGGRFRKLGLRPWSAKRPLVTALSMFGNVVNGLQSGETEMRQKDSGTHHLIAMAVKR